VISGTVGLVFKQRQRIFQCSLSVSLVKLYFYMTVHCRSANCSFISVTKCK